MSDDLDWYRGRRVLVTGHTGFKGSWLCLWLQQLGARVTGFARTPEKPSLFADAKVGAGMHSVIGDICDQAALDDALCTADPEIIFHLAAQSLVRRSYDEPVETFATNVIGTVNLLNLARRHTGLRAVVNVTSDKCYENNGSGRPFLEADPMGGHDPYSASKGAAELVAAAMERSFLRKAGIGLASARAGNVIGGGDWSADRIVPDIVRAALAGRPVQIRRPEAVRPWQHVLEPLRGYLMLGQRLATEGRGFAGGWNFGPDSDAIVSVRAILDGISRRWPDVRPEFSAHCAGPYEASVLRLDIAKVRARLGWHPVLSLDETLDLTVDWYVRTAHGPGSTRALTLSQIEAFYLKTRQHEKVTPQ
jgi:CDP-glucose 4,6-dehydratase